MAPQDMDIIAARDLKVGDVILDGQRKPYVERRVITLAQFPTPMQRLVGLDTDGELGSLTREYKIDDYVAILPRVVNEAVAA